MRLSGCCSCPVSWSRGWSHGSAYLVIGLFYLCTLYAYYTPIQKFKKWVKQIQYILLYLCDLAGSLLSWKSRDAVDPWTTPVWTVQVRLYVDFFFNKYVHYGTTRSRVGWIHAWGTVDTEKPHLQTMNYMWIFDCIAGRRSNSHSVQGVVPCTLNEKQPFQGNSHMAECVLLTPGALVDGYTPQSLRGRGTVLVSTLTERHMGSQKGTQKT